MTIFLDIDGVLNKKSQWKTLYSVNENCVKAFAELCKKIPGNPVIVLTSSWRHGFVNTMDEENAPYIQNLEQIMDKYGIRITDKTPALKGRTRDKEIERYLYFHPESRYVIIDDDKGEYGAIDRHNCFVNAEYGFCETDIKRVMKCI